MACDHAQLDTVRIVGITQPEYSYAVEHVGTGSAEQDTARVTIKPLQIGTFPLTIHSIYVHDDFTVQDTTFTLTLIVKDNPAVLSVSRKDTIDFGSQTLCTAKLRADSVNIRNLGCDAMQVDSIWMQAGQAGNDFTFSPVHGYTVNNGDSATHYRFSFKPTQAEQETAKIFIKTSAGTDTLYLKGAGLANSQSIELAVDTLASQVCDSANGMLIITNASCNLMALDSILLPQPMYLLPNQLPLGLPSGQSQQVQVRFVPTTPGSDTISFHAVLRSIFSGDTTRVDTVLTFIASARPGNPAVSIPNTTINFGSVSTCSNATLPTFFISTGCDSLAVTGEVLSAQNGFSALNAHTGSLAVGTKDSVLVKFVPPGVGNFYDTLQVSTSAGVRKVYVSAQGAAGTKVLSIDSTLRNFGTNSVCRIADTSIIFKNTGCDSLTVENVTLVGQNYLLNGSKTPKVLAPGSSDTIAVQFIPTIAGTATGTVTLRTNADRDSIVNIPFTAQSVAPQTLTFQTALSRANIQTGDTTTLFVTPASTVTVSGLTTLSSTISYDGDLLTYVPNTATTSSGFTISNPVETRSGKISTLNLTLNATGNPTTFTEGQTLASVRFRTTLTDSLSTPITLGNLVLNNGDSLFNRCMLSLNDSNTSFALALNCGDSVVNAELRGALPFALQSIVPNPTSGKLTVNLSGPSDLWVLYDLYDLLGHSVMRGTLSGSANTLDVSALSSGNYYLRMSGSGEVVSRRILVQK